MSDFFSYQAKRALEGDPDNAQHLFSEMASQTSCHPPSLTSTGLISPSHVSGSYYTNSPYHGPYMGNLPPYTGSPIAGNYDVSTPPPFSPTYPFDETMAVPIPTSHLQLDASPRLHRQQPPPQQQQTQQELSRSPLTRSESPDSGDLTNYGTRNMDGTWRCAYPGCSSRTIFTRACDLRKHFNRHNKYLFCRYDGCPQATEGGFSSKKDRARHEAKHNPEIVCEWEGCGRVFSRVDNMKDHVRRIHKKRLQ